MTNVLVRLHGIEVTQQTGSTVLGETPTSKVQMEGVLITAMIDTGSPITIVSLDYLFATLAKVRPNEESPAQWQARVKARLQPTSI